MKKILFITYYWPPSGKASLHWPLYIIKHLSELNLQPSVLTVKDEKFSHIDESLTNEINSETKIINTKAWEPFNLYRKFIGKEKDEPLVASETISETNTSITHRISVWIRMNLFIPDARIGWYFSAVKSGKKFLKNNKQDFIVSIGPPHSTHLIAKKLSKKFNIPHIPVFIDPWTNIIYYKNLKRSKLTLKIDNHLEKKVLLNAWKIIFITETMKTDYVKKYPQIENKSQVLYWGYNEENFKSRSPSLIPSEKNDLTKNNNLEIIVHAGNIFDYQNPKNFWKYIKSEIDKGRKINLKFIGTVSPEIRNSIKQYGLNNHVSYLGFLPYEKMIDELLKASYLLVCATEPRHVPGKLFEYLKTGKPIIGFGDDNEEVRRILKETNAGMIFKYSEDAHEFFELINTFNTNLSQVKIYDRKNIAKQFNEILNE